MAKPTAGEQARIDQLEAQVAEMDLPDGVDISFGVMDADDSVAQIAEADAAVFAPVAAFGSGELSDGEEVPVALISGLEWLEELVVAERVTCDWFGIVNELVTDDGARVPIGLQGHMRLRVHPQDVNVPLYVNFEPAEAAWKEAAMHRFAICWPERADGRNAYLATGPMRQHDSSFVMPGRSNRSKAVGRNEPCPCGSGVKFKRCHGT